MKHRPHGMAFLLIFACVWGLAACGAGGQGPADSQGAFTSAENALYGKITSITGNEIQVALAKPPADDGRGAEELQGEAITPSENDMPVVGGESIQDPASDLTFTGETRSFSLPAGIQIHSMGQEITLSGLNKGDVISVSVDPENPDTVVAVEKVK